MAKRMISFSPQNNPGVTFALQMRKVRPGKMSATHKVAEPDQILALPDSEVGAFVAKPGCVPSARCGMVVRCTHCEPDYPC